MLGSLFFFAPLSILWRGNLGGEATADGTTAEGGGYFLNRSTVQVATGFDAPLPLL
jgi:hypothetical protein